MTVNTSWHCWLPGYHTALQSSTSVRHNIDTGLRCGNLHQHQDKHQALPCHSHCHCKIFNSLIFEHFSSFTMLWVVRIMNSVFTERVQIEKNVGNGKFSKIKIWILNVWFFWDDSYESAYSLAQNLLQFQSLKIKLWPTRLGQIFDPQILILFYSKL